MKTRFLLPLACAAALAVAVPAHARNDAARNMIIGGVAGAIIGEHNDHHAAEGAFLGATAGLLFTAITDDNDRGHVVHYTSAPAYASHRPVVIARPYCPPAPRVVVVRPAPHHSRNVVVVRPACRPAPRVVVVESRHDRRDRRDDRREARYDNRSDRREDRREARHDRQDDRRDDRRDDRGYAYSR
ncbi:MAG: hypothetical protein IPL39_00135 [Opitutaceae bacterium]|nr:hypothetical protein [Opitutaceae bacterium]